MVINDELVQWLGLGLLTERSQVQTSLWSSLRYRKSLSEGLSFRLGGGSSLDGAGFTPTLSVVPSGGLCWRFSSHRVDWSVSSSGGSSRAPMLAVVRSSLSQILKLTFQKKNAHVL